MLSQSLSLLSQVRRWNLAQSVEQLGLRRRSRQPFPRALTLQGAPRETLVPRDAPHPTPRIAQQAFDRIMGPRQAGHIITVEEAGPIVSTHFVKVKAKVRERG